MKTTSDNFFYWAILLSFIFPFFQIFLTEIKARNKNENLDKSLGLLKNTVVPLMLIYMIIQYVFLIPEENTYLKITKTFFYISIINTILSFVNAYLLSGRIQLKLSKIFLDLIKLVLVLIGALFVLANVWGIDLQGMIASLGIGSIVIGLALQDTLGNAVSGLIVLVKRPFIVGDVIKVGGELGTVIEMNWNSVFIKKSDNSIVIMSQSTIAKQTLVNFTKITKNRETSIELNFSYDYPPNYIRKILREMLDSIPEIEHSESKTVNVSNLGDYNITYKLVFSCHGSLSVTKVNNIVLTRMWYVAKRYNLKTDLKVSKVYNEKLDREEVISHNELKNFSIFFSLQSEILEFIAKGATLHNYAIGENIIKEGDALSSLFIVLEGHANALVKNNNGENKIAFKLAKGDFFGESSLFSGESIDITVNAIDDVNLLILPKNIVDTILEKKPALIKEIGSTMSLRRELMYDQKEELINPTSDLLLK